MRRSPDSGAAARPDESLDPGARSLAEALTVCFGLLKIVMALLIVAFLFSGAFNVNEGEVAVRLRFGRLQGAPGQQVIEPGGPNFAQSCSSKPNPLPVHDALTFW